MTLILNIILLISGIASATSIMLLAPKGGLGFGVGGMAGGGSSNEYGSKKTLEHTIKRIAIIAGIIFAVACLLYPYLHG